MRNNNIKVMRMVMSYGGSYKTYLKVDRKNLKHVPARKVKSMWSNLQYELRCYDYAWLELMMLGHVNERSLIKDLTLGQRYGSSFVEETLTALKEITIGY